MVSIGSSPRLRGTHRPRSGPRPERRFIPAPAGNTASWSSNAAHRAVHPRACGEHRAGLVSTTDPRGSSPRLRGTRFHLHVQGRVFRFIPAPAGNTDCIRQGKRRSAVHPRACGEHYRQGRFLSLPVGSSPRLRGTPCRSPGHAASTRFIPAPAGNTPGPRLRRRSRPVHPRACGEHHEAGMWARAIIGSSPRLRGTPLLRKRCKHSRRFIPAPAGNTALSSPRRTLWPVHPRACGEHRNGQQNVVP